MSSEASSSSSKSAVSVPSTHERVVRQYEDTPRLVRNAVITAAVLIVLGGLAVGLAFGLPIDSAVTPLKGAGIGLGAAAMLSIVYAAVLYKKRPDEDSALEARVTCAIKNGDQQELEKIFGNDNNNYRLCAYTNKKTDKTALLLAAEHGTLEIFKWIYKLYADLYCLETESTDPYFLLEEDATGANAIALAAINGRQDIINFLGESCTQKGNNDREDIFLTAIDQAVSCIITSPSSKMQTEELMQLKNGFSSFDFEYSYSQAILFAAKRGDVKAIQLLEAKKKAAGIENDTVDYCNTGLRACFPDCTLNPVSIALFYGRVEVLSHFFDAIVDKKKFTEEAAKVASSKTIDWLISNTDITLQALFPHRH